MLRRHGSISAWDEVKDRNGNEMQTLAVTGVMKFRISSCCVVAVYN
jgi:hypothetical protein